MRAFGFQPNEHTFIGVFASCAAEEAVEEGFIHLESMKTEYGITPEIEHYLGVIDVLGQSGHLPEAFEYMETLPFEPTSAIWEALMNYARMHGDIDLEDRAEAFLIDIDPSKAVTTKIPTPLTNNQFAINMLLDKLGEVKDPTLYKDEEKLRDAKKKERTLKCNFLRNFNDLDNEAKKPYILSHSERLAIAVGLVNTPARATLRIIKLQRMCGVCHTAVKNICKIVGREIIVRDKKYVHVFKDGKCSCEDHPYKTNIQNDDH